MKSVCLTCVAALVAVRSYAADGTSFSTFICPPRTSNTIRTDSGWRPGVVSSWPIMVVSGTFSTTASLLSKQDQEDLWNANALYFDDPAVPNSSRYQVKHVASNTWPRSREGRMLRKRASKAYIYGVEIRGLFPPHILAGQHGLFAAKAFRMFDIVGEYCGEVYDSDDGGEYATYLEHPDELLNNNKKKYALGVDARRCGNECRFINHYEGIAKEPNVVMKTCYVEELPRVVIVCRRDIGVGEELLLRYSDEYVEAYIL